MYIPAFVYGLPSASDAPYCVAMAYVAGITACFEIYISNYRSQTFFPTKRTRRAQNTESQLGRMVNQASMVNALSFYGHSPQERRLLCLCPYSIDVIADSKKQRKSKSNYNYIIMCIVIYHRWSTHAKDILWN